MLAFDAQASFKRGGVRHETSHLIPVGSGVDDIVREGSYGGRRPVPHELHVILWSKPPSQDRSLL